MKFKRGFWLMQPNIDPLYAVEVYRVRVNDASPEKSIELLIATKHIAGRGDTMTAALNLRLFSPAEPFQVLPVLLYDRQEPPCRFTGDLQCVLQRLIQFQDLHPAA